MKMLLNVLLCCCPFAAFFAQKTAKPAKYWVEFRDKKDTPFCACRPAEFLSARALERRARAGIAIVENDLPVNPHYLDALRTAGANIHTTSRWLNAAAILADSAAVSRIRQLPFVQKVEYIGWHIKPRNKPNSPPKTREGLAEIPQTPGADPIFGYAALQNSLLGTPFLYRAGGRGAGIWVAVMDGGFTNADALPFFDSAAIHNRLFSAWDVVEHDHYVFEDAAHGTSVLSVMAANLPGHFVGTAPDATFFCLKTEDVGGELPVEESNWIAGAEWADSLGADIINASLGYTSFGDTSLSHKYLQLDGRSSIGARGAAIAATKGMIICNSAGNSGDEPWRHIGVPADAPGIVAVGATDFDGLHASFSSLGPTADGRIKPDLSAPGDALITAGNRGASLGQASGTSVASPMLAGALASLWSLFPEKTAAEILDAAFAAASQSASPDNELGYGLPDLSLAFLRLAGFAEGDFWKFAEQGILFTFSRERGELSFLSGSNFLKKAQRLTLTDALGRNFRLENPRTTAHAISTMTISGLEKLPPGAYTATFWLEKTPLRCRVIIPK